MRNMLKQLLRSITYIILFVAPTFLMAQPPTWSGGGSLCDTCATPIDQQTLLLASGGIVYALHKIRESRKK